MDIELNDNTSQMLLRLPFSMDWVKYKGEDYFASINFQATEKAGKPMIDLSYCATKSMNNIVLKTVQYDKNKFTLK